VEDTITSPSINASIPSYPSNTISYPEIALMTAWTGLFPTGNTQPFSPVADPHAKLKLVAEEKYSTTEKGGGKSLLGGQLSSRFKIVKEREGKDEDESEDGGGLHRIREKVSKHHLELVEARVRSELPLEELSDVGSIAEDVGERSSVGGVGGVYLCPGVFAGGAGVGVQVGEDD
jgi:hypothetical protein